MPAVFKDLYSSTRCIIGATEVFIQRPQNPTVQQLTFSSYKNHNTFEALIAISPSGAICFIFDLFGGITFQIRNSLQNVDYWSTLKKEIRQWHIYIEVLT